MKAAPNIIYYIYIVYVKKSIHCHNYEGSRGYLEVELAVDSLVVLVDQFEGVGAISIHVAIAIGNTSVTKQERHLVKTRMTSITRMTRTTSITRIGIQFFCISHINNENGQNSNFTNYQQVHILSCIIHK